MYRAYQAQGICPHAEYRGVQAMRDCPQCGEPLAPNSKTCGNCELPIIQKLPTPQELAAQTTKPLQKLLAKPPDPYPQDKHDPIDTRTHSLLT